MTGLLTSWVESANDPKTDFPLNNLPYGRFLKDQHLPTPCLAIGDRVLDLGALERTGLLSIDGCGDVFQSVELSGFMEAGPRVWRPMRRRLTDLLAKGLAEKTTVSACLLPMTDVAMALPFTVTEYTDFYASKHHAFNVGSMFRGPENALPPNWLHMPIGYNGRASSVVVSGTDVVRPHGQLKGPNEDAPCFGPSERFDFELELGAVVGRPSSGPISVAEAFDNIFGYVLLNDWSARDIQAWEYQPLGPFQSKATATSISPWIVTAEALKPFRTDTPEREVPLLPHLADDGPMLYDIALEIGLQPQGGAETVVARTNYREMYYSAAQQLAHHSSSGCTMRVGDLLGSGTISGPKRDSCGSMLELSWGGKEPVQIAGGTRSFLEDGDTVSLRGAANGDGYRVGFGACVGTVLQAAT